jgi:trehalose/maltose hydrolase-like predicted phosphorylase
MSSLSDEVAASVVPSALDLLRASLLDGVPDFTQTVAALTDMTWFLREDDFEPALEHELESRFSIGNGFIGMRGSLDIPVEASRPRTYIAGLYALRPGPPPLSALMPAPHAFPIRLLIDGEALDIGHGSVRQHSRLLDYRAGVLRSLWQHEMPSGRVLSIESLRFVSLATVPLALQLLRLCLDAPAKVSVQLMEDQIQLSQLDGSSVWRTDGGRLALACLRQVRLRRDARQPSRWTNLQGLPTLVSCERELAVFQLSSYGLAEQPKAALEEAGGALRSAKRAGLPGVYERHVKHWQDRWESSDVVVEGNDEAQRALRFAVYHLNSAAHAGRPDVSVAARGLTGDGYLGHVFWDTELFMLPFYTFARPAAARTLL